MGIPSYFKTILNKYPQSIHKKLKKQIEYFFIDFNSIIYDSVVKIDFEKHKNKSMTQLENILIKEVINDLQNLICTYVKPSKMVYIAMDGVAPRAKMIQQRFRRFKGIIETEYKNELKEKYNIPIYKSFTGMFSPGTKFMIKLSKQIEKAIKAKKFSKHTKKELKFILSDTSNPGEGEHKYMPVLRSLVSTNSSSNVVVLSPDADVIVLSMLSKKENVFIMRPTKDMGNFALDVNYIYLEVDFISKIFIETLMGDSTKNKERLLYDYIFLTSIEGNDFVIPIKFMKMRIDNMRILTKIYNEVSESEYLVDITESGFSINKSFFMRILQKIADIEQNKFQGLMKRIHYTKKNNKPNTKNEEGKSEYEIAISRFEHKPYYDKLNPYYHKYIKEFNKIDFWKNNWKEQYYEYFLQINTKNKKEYNYFMKRVCQNYLEGFYFNMEYYISGIPAWRWHYRYRCAPMASDLLEYMKSNPKCLDITIDKMTPYTQLQQLFMIIPPQLKSLLPTKYGKLIDNIDSGLVQYFPITFELDVVMGDKFIYSEPLLPEINDEKVIEELNKIKLSKTDQERNKLSDNVIEIII